MRNLIIVLGDQLDADSSVFADFDSEHDAVWMAEVPGEATQVWSSKPRIVMFLAAMRHFRDLLIDRGYRVHYRALGEHVAPTLEAALAEDLAQLKPQQVIAVQPGEWRLAQSLPTVVAQAGVRWITRSDNHFYCDQEDFLQWAKTRKEYRLEFFYRWLRKRENVLMDDDQPTGGQWNFDSENRQSFDKRGPGMLPMPKAFQPDAVTQQVIEQVNTQFASHPGTLNDFDWPVTSQQAIAALNDFIEHRLPLFGRYQDAIWTQTPWVYHARISAALNLKLLNPRSAVQAAVDAYHQGKVPLATVEGFVRQILGWREFIRGIYWLRMPDFLQDNALNADQPLPAFYWTGDTTMVCLRDAIGQTLRYGYAHHIQRLMVTGLFAQLLGVTPQAIHEWYLAVYIDAVEWAELPNVLGMSQYADGGLMVSKPYVASGKYIERMSNYCSGCRFDSAQAVGEKACPFTTLYWDFLAKHNQRFASHPRTALQWKNLQRKSVDEIAAIQEQARLIRITLMPDSHTEHSYASEIDA